MLVSTRWIRYKISKWEGNKMNKLAKIDNKKKQNNHCNKYNSTKKIESLSTLEGYHSKWKIKKYIISLEAAIMLKKVLFMVKIQMEERMVLVQYFLKNKKMLKKQLNNSMANQLGTDF